MTGRNNHEVRSQKNSDRATRYSLKKLSVGVASVAVGATLFLGGNVTASAEEASETQEATEEVVEEEPIEEEPVVEETEEVVEETPEAEPEPEVEETVAPAPAATTLQPDEELVEEPVEEPVVEEEAENETQPEADQAVQERQAVTPAQVNTYPEEEAVEEDTEATVDEETQAGEDSEVDENEETPEEDVTDEVAPTEEEISAANADISVAQVDDQAPATPEISPFSQDTHMISVSADANTDVTLTFPDGTGLTQPANSVGNVNFTLPEELELTVGDTVTAVATNENGQTSEPASFEIPDAYEVTNFTVDPILPGDSHENVTGTAVPGAYVTAHFANGSSTSGQADENGDFTIDSGFLSYAINPGDPVNFSVAVNGDIYRFFDVYSVEEEPQTTIEAPEVYDLATGKSRAEGMTPEGAEEIRVYLPADTEEYRTADILSARPGTNDHAFSLALPEGYELPAGEEVRVTAVDENGNESEATVKTVIDSVEAAQLTVDSIAPEAETISGTVNPEATVQVVLPGGTQISANVNDDGTWSVNTLGNASSLEVGEPVDVRVRLDGNTHNFENEFFVEGVELPRPETPRNERLPHGTTINVEDFVTNMEEFPEGTTFEFYDYDTQTGSESVTLDVSPNPETRNENLVIRATHPDAEDYADSFRFTVIIEAPEEAPISLEESSHHFTRLGYYGDRYYRNTITLNDEFGRPVEGLTEADFNIDTFGGIANFEADGNVYTLDTEQAGELRPDHSLSVEDGVVQVNIADEREGDIDLENSNLHFTRLGSYNNRYYRNTITLNDEFGRPVEGLTEADFNIDNYGGIANFEADGNEYTLDTEYADDLRPDHSLSMGENGVINVDIEEFNTVNFDANGGEIDGVNRVDVPVDESYQVPYNFTLGLTRPGYTFTGWRINDEGEVLSPYQPTINPTGDVTLVAQWEETSGKFTIEDGTPGFRNDERSFTLTDGENTYNLTSNSYGSNDRTWEVEGVPNGVYTLLIDGVAYPAEEFNLEKNGHLDTESQVSINDEGLITFDLTFEDDSSSTFIRYDLSVNTYPIGIEVRDQAGSRTTEADVVITDSNGQLVDGSFNEYGQWGSNEELLPGQYPITLQTPEGTVAKINDTVASQNAVATNQANVFTLDLNQENLGNLSSVFGAFQLVEEDTAPEEIVGQAYIEVVFPGEEANTSPVAPMVMTLSAAPAQVNNFTPVTVTLTDAEGNVYQVDTNENGVAYFEELPGGTYQAAIEDFEIDGYRSTTPTITIDENGQTVNGQITFVELPAEEDESVPMTPIEDIATPIEEDESIPMTPIEDIATPVEEDDSVSMTPIEDIATPIEEDDSVPMTPIEDIATPIEEEEQKVHDEKDEVDSVDEVSAEPTVTSDKDEAQAGTVPQAKESTEREGEKLPDTATGVWGVGLAGLISLLGGAGVSIFKKKEDK